MRLPLILTACLLAIPTAPAAEPRVDYLRAVKPIFRQRCFGCHGALKQRGGLRLDTGSLIRQGGDTGPAVMPGSVAKSLLVGRITAPDRASRMPPKGEPLTADQVRIIKTWIAQGATSPGDERPEQDPRSHWAFRKPVRPVLPAVNNREWVRNPLDAFLAAEHEKHGLTPLPPAEKHVLLRRVYLDLIGLPPTRAELHAFLADTSPDAYEKVVDRLLASPQYGERWGRHWMDVWRYSDWYGRRRVPDVLNSYAQIWRWRDWIVRSLNEDKGYDRMVMEMLAADEIAPTDQENIVATGFIVRNFYRWNYNIWMKDQVEHTGKAFLGLTFNCCHCHDHKYDPITNVEYFRFRAFFEPIEIRHDRVPGEPDPGPYPKYEYGKAYKPITSGLVRVMDEKLDAKTFMYSGGQARNVIPGKPPVSPGAPAVLGGDHLKIERIDLPATSWYPGLKPFVRREAIDKAEGELAKVKETLAKAKQLLANAKDDAAREAAEWTLRVDQANVTRAEAALAAVHSRIHADQVRYQGEPGDPDDAARTASKAERQVALEAARVELARAERTLATARRKPSADAKARAAITRAEGQVSAARAKVEKAEKALAGESTQYTLFSPQYPKQSTGRRTALARWIASEDNPLTARVAVNHIWRWHFGRALVKTTENLGRNGARPTHPELLDWLAVELMANGWRMKPLHRLIVTSNAYRMSSHPGTPDSPSQKIDRDNVYLWRFNPARMEAEVLRDSILHVAGSLERTIGGKEIPQKQGLTSPRRSLYFEHHGEGQMMFLELFDTANPCDCYRRSTSVRPQQALAMVNGELSLRQGRSLARRLGEQLGEEDLVTAAFEQILTRPPTPAERQASLAFLGKQRELFRSATPEELSAGTKDPDLRARESFLQALFSHHDFVTIR
jgi:mono/diheme cytochrome c family protein